MIAFTRRHMLSLGSAPTPFAASPACPADILPNLPASGMPLTDALRRRRSVREFATMPLPEELLLTLLWCALGINRPATGGRTAPAWNRVAETEIYLAGLAGIRRYDPPSGRLVRISDRDVRPMLSREAFVAAAPEVLIYVADLSRMEGWPADQQPLAAVVDAAVIAENVYLYCASVEFGTCLVSGLYRSAIAGLLGLPGHKRVTFVQPVGYPRA